MKKIRLILSAFMLRDLKIETSYRFSFLLRLSGIFFQLAVFYFISSLVPEETLSGYFPFVAAGLAFSQSFHCAMGACADSLRQEQLCGTLDSLFAAPVSPGLIKAGLAAWKFVTAMAETAAYLLIASFFFGMPLNFNALIKAVPVAVLCMAVFFHLGTISASFILVFKKGDPLQWTFSHLSDLLGGVYFPVTLLPWWLKAVSIFIPTTYALNAIRASLAGSSPARSDILMLAVFLGILWPLSRWSFDKALAKARMEGSLGHY